MITRETTVVIIGGGPGGYEAALVGAQLGANVTIIERLGVGGAAVLTDCVPSKALIATADYMSDFEVAAGLGVRLADDGADIVAQPQTVNERILALASAQSADIHRSLEQAGVRIISGTGRTVACVDHARLCRCGASKTKPFCDESHRRIGFRSL